MITNDITANDVNVNQSQDNENHPFSFYSTNPIGRSELWNEARNMRRQDQQRLQEQMKVMECTFAPNVNSKNQSNDAWRNSNDSRYNSCNNDQGKERQSVESIR